MRFLMQTNHFTTLFVVVTAATLSNVNSQGIPCNPASWCHPDSLLCKSAEAINAMLEGREEPESAHSRGVCTDAYRWFCNSAGFNCRRYPYSIEEAWTRCQEIMDPSKKNQLYPGKYVGACRDGEFTCESGLCTTKASNCKGKIRYGNSRCPRDSCGAENVLKDICEFTSNPVESSYECVEKPLAGVPACCPSDNALECRYLELEGAADVSLRQCGGECPDPCAPTASPVTMEPTSNPTGRTPAPTNRPDGQVTPTVPPTPVPTSNQPTIVEYPPAGVLIKFEQKTEDRDCCCKLSCDCFGDPHCTSFFGNQQTSKVSTGSFDMFRNQKIGIKAFLGPPQGIMEKIEVTTSEDPRTFVLTTKQCNNATHNWQDAATGKFINDIPSNWDASYSIDPEGFTGYSDPSLYNVRDSGGEILFEIKCQPFLWVSNRDYDNPKYTRSTRIDIVVTAWRDKVIKEGTNEVCCPSQDENAEWVIQTGASGYCVDPAAQPIPGANNNRRLEASNVKKSSSDVPLLGFSYGKELDMMYDAQASDEINFHRSLKTAEEICKEYLDKAGTSAIAALSTMEQCLQNIGDFGIGSIATLIEMIDLEGKKCISSPLDPRLPEGGLRECEAGVVLEIQLAGSSEWLEYRSFPAGLPYCANSVLFDFTKIEISPGRFLSAKDRYRLKQCTPNAERCGVCAPLLSVQNTGFSFAYECETYDAYKNFLKFDLLEGMRNGEFACGYKYFGNPDPFSCLRDYLPALFRK